MKTVVLFSVLLSSLIQASQAKDSCSAKPDFRAPGRRIIEEKCREFNWQRKCAQDGEVNEIPYLGAVGFPKDGGLQFSCAATLISPKFAVTAAHCAKGFKELVPEFVRFGNKNIKAVPVVDAKIARTITHPQFKPPMRNFDVALLEFESPLPITRAVSPACLWSQPEISYNQDVDVPAWGAISGEKQPDTLKIMKVQAIDPATCQPHIEKYFNRHWNKLEDNQLCVNETSDKEYYCRGSSGAPFVTSVSVGEGDFMPYVQAFASFGAGCKPSVAVYSKISSVADWIEQTVWPQP